MARATAVFGTLLAAFVLALALPPPAATACSCEEPDAAMVETWLDEADGAFVGSSTGRTGADPGPDGLVSSGQATAMTFAVDGVAKGDLGPTVVVSTPLDEASCGITGGGPMAVLLEGSATDGWSSHLCWVVPIDFLEAATDMHPPDQAVASDVGAAGSRQPPSTAVLALAVGAIALAAILGSAAIARARS